jgi:hypothetical protein
MRDESNLPDNIGKLVLICLLLSKVGSILT